MWRCHIITPTPRLPIRYQDERPGRIFHHELSNEIKHEASYHGLRFEQGIYPKSLLPCILNDVTEMKAKDVMDGSSSRLGCHGMPQNQKKKSKEFCEMRLLSTADIFSFSAILLVKLGRLSFSRSLPDSWPYLHYGDSHMMSRGG